MNDPSRVRVTGPLAAYAPGFRAELEARGYSRGSVALRLQLAAQVSRWLDAQGLDLGDLMPERVEEFFALRRAKVKVLFVSPRSLRVLLDHLRDVGALPPPPAVEPTELDLFMERYRRYLLHERGLVQGTTRRYVHVARRFLVACGGRTDAAAVEAVTPQAAIEFLSSECTTHTIAWGKAVAVALRGLLRFLHVEGLIDQPLAQAVPTPAGWSAAGLPTALTPDEVAALLAGCDRRIPAGRRDYAVLVMLARLGLRSAEVTAVDLADVDWRGGRLRIRGKGSRVDVLPLPAEVGRALADYVRNGRPRVGRGALFRRIGAPHGALAPSTVTGIVYRACDRAGVARVGAHRLRHTAATQMLRGGASLSEIAQVLRHASTATTSIYAKVDRLALAALARPWPGGVA